MKTLRPLTDARFRLVARGRKGGCGRRWASRLPFVSFLALAFAQPALGQTVGSTVTNPVTGAAETVVQVFADDNGETFEVLTSAGNIIGTLTQVGETYESQGVTYTVTAVATNATTMLVDSITVQPSTTGAAPITDAVVTNVSSTIAGNAPQPGAPPVIPPTATSGVINDSYKAAGGGNGGNAYGIEVFGVTIGESGSNGGNGDPGATINLTVPSSHGAITSTGNSINGITYGSSGGNGGKGGNSYGNIGPYSGGTGGSGGIVNLENDTSISTAGTQADGIFAYSSSGTGGSGGTGYIFSGGGSGGGVGMGGPVSVTNNGNITTNGNGSDGIYALSTGGSAGSGGGSYGIVGEGGNGSSGGNGGDVSVTNNATIITDGVGSHGVFAQSVGGSGGNGGDAGGIVSFGGNGTSGGVGGDVAITNSGSITTSGSNSIGLFGQSIGGGGGDSGSAGAIVTLGGSGGSGNDSGTVTINNDAGGQIETYGQDSYGILGQSVGGGGGNTSPSGGLVTIGGTASGGGSGNTVSIYDDGVIGTSGTNAIGIFAQSIGGGGGSAGASGGLVTLGGQGSDGGNGAAVSVTNDTSGAITTTGVGAYAIFAQSIGGGGGAGGASGGAVSIGGSGSSGGSGNTVTVTNSGALSTTNLGARGIFAQSIGGGGGAGGASGGIVSLGGTSSAASNANTVTVTNNASGTISTADEGADAIFVQSIGGGGGAGGVSGGLIALGGSGSGGGMGGDVTVTNAGTLETQGLDARGIFAQSIGGGGGSGGSGGGLVTIGGSGNDAGAGETVTVDNTGKITTTNDQSTAIFAQSVGGGGGDGGTTGGLLTIGGSGASGGAAGDVSVTQSGEISTKGVGAMGIFAQSVGGGGGNGGAADSGSLFLGLALGGNGAGGGAGGTTSVVLSSYDLNGSLVPSLISTQGEEATGILAQSVGGGGGNGGDAIQATIGAGASLSIAIGGGGGAGGIGGAVSLTGANGTLGIGNVVTEGDNAAGIILQSVGGGGGNGGAAVAASASASLGASLSASVAIGGTGGSGGQGGTVTADVTSAIQTGESLSNAQPSPTGDFSSGFIAQSIGGGGGNGGTTIAASASFAPVGAAAFGVSVGGDGGLGGAGGTVNVTLDGSVTTQQAQSDGVVIQSIGGGGGNGGLAVSAALAGAGGAAGTITVGMGGSGGGGGLGGQVNATLDNNVTTAGDGSNGVIIQSIGGGGGNSGLTVSAGAAGAGIGAAGISIGIGGSGGSGGDGGIVDGSYAGHLVTDGDHATGLLVQSVGGGGGNSGGTIAASLDGAGVGAGAISLGLGGSGGGAGNGGTSTTVTDVTLDTSGTVATDGSYSSGIVVQSIGGGGGNGGYDIAASLSGAGVGSGAVSVGLGGGAGGGGNGESVMATLGSDISTLGDDSTGAVVQSVGGGGGNGGFNVSGSLSGAGVGGGGISVGLGGTSGGGGSGGDVNGSSTGTIDTTGFNSSGFVVQSIGGGGGNGGFNVTTSLSGAGVGSGAITVGLGGSGGNAGNAGTVAASTSGSIVTMGDDSTGILAQSLGGGGGNGAFDISVAASGAGTGSGAIGVGLGGGGTGGGSGSTVQLTVHNDVTTFGDDSAGIVAQSIGGGGGNGGFNVSVAGSGAGIGSGVASIGLGGGAGGGGSAGDVTSTVVGTLMTSGNNSTGLLVQSVGGGGGNGGFDVSAGLSGAGTGSGSVAVGIGGSGGSGGNAGVVNSSQTGDVTTLGNDSAGVIAQSLGGGGGDGGLNVSAAISGAGTGSGAISVGIGGSGGGGGAANQVTNDVTGNVMTSGTDAIGVLAQSAGGGGGNGGLSIDGSISLAGTGSGAVSVGLGGTGGNGGGANDVSSNVTGDVYTLGNGSSGVVAQSLGGGGGTGGIDVSGDINLSKEDGGAVGIGIGGFGGGGGTAENVTSTVTADGSGGDPGDVATLGNDASAIVAESLGGGGGVGGLNVTGAINLGGGSGAAVGVGLGGFGGSGGNAGDVVLGVNVTGVVATYGTASDGLVAQSIAGGGGNGATNVTGSMALSTGAGGSSTTVAASIGVGGFGGGGGNAGTVNVSYDGSEVYAANGSGVVAQSIGGGGGNGGLDVSAGISYAGGSDSSGYGLVVGVGGFGGGGGSGNTVDVDITGGGSISAGGIGQSGILAQSVGGGGGNGGVNASGGVVSSSPLLIGVGGFGANAGIAQDVTVDATADVDASGSSTDSGVSSAGVLAQSIGGGGGNGGMNVTGGLAISKSTAPSISVGIGGFGGSGALSGAVAVNFAGNVVSSGDQVGGIVGQSIAGGGGNGGLDVDSEINFANSDSSGGSTDLTILAGVGGTAGQGANAGTVSITDNGKVATDGDNATGVFAQSVGGGGGTGGMNVSGVFAQNSSPITVAVGGSGSIGGNGGDVTITRGTASASTALVSTDGATSNGIEASSIGGGGGDAGMNFNVGVSNAGKGGNDSGFAAQFAIGGAGAGAGDAGVATVDNYSEVTTVGNNSDGIIAQSVGGGGGNATFNLSFTYEGAKPTSGTNENMGFSMAIGGATGDGGTGGEAHVVSVGDVTTMGTDSDGIVSQSIGGGGGNAGISLAIFKGDGGKVGITLGSEGGTGGSGSDVTLSSTGSVITMGDTSYGLLAQSLGNGGGNSSATSISAQAPTETDTPTSSLALSVGLEGGTGGSAGSVTLNAAGSVDTEGMNSYAVVAQSIGGGGGNGASANTLGLSAPTVALSLGGTGGSGGTGGDVAVTSSADVTTLSDGSIGILAQSIGGGGGTGGMAESGGFAPNQMSGTSITAAIGGTGGTGMSSGIVTVDTSGIIQTTGMGADGVLAQSLGGGGGNSSLTITTRAGSSTEESSSVALSIGGDGGTGAVSNDVTVTNSNLIATTGDNSLGIFAQSIGGGGGNAGTLFNGSLTTGGGQGNLAVTIGGTGGTGASSADVVVENLTHGQIETQGTGSTGILAMSIGGGGGNGSTVVNAQLATAAAANSQTQSVTITLGGDGGSGGTGQAVTVENQGVITTTGNSADGIAALSIGGGGGNGGMSLSGNLAMGTPAASTGSKTAVAISLGGSGGDGNTSSTVTVNNSGNISTAGTSSDGIFAESIGGGGGNGGFSASLSPNAFSNPETNLAGSLSNMALGGTGGNGANSGNVTVTNSGTITVSGANSYGIYAQSVSGGGGNAGYSVSAPAWMAVGDGIFSTLLGGGSTGQAGTVTINSDGNINMTGQNDMAQFQQSVNGGGGNVNIFLNLSQQAIDVDAAGNSLPPNPSVLQQVEAVVRNSLVLGSDPPTNAVGGAVMSTSNGNLSTTGYQSEASLTQSIGGGGGNAVSNVSVDTAGEVDQTIALGETSISLTPENNSGGNITISRTGTVSTSGDDSPGSGVQSIGGGGGNAISDVTVVADGTPPSSISPLTVIAALGANGGIGNNGGTVLLTYTGAVSTAGNRSYGLLAQSIGGGGGAMDVTGYDNAQISLGGQNGASGNGGDITVMNTGAITTTGALSDGVILQSIGGGGGLSLTDLATSDIALTLNAGNSGDGGSIHFTQQGNITVGGAGSVGILAQSLGGGGGIVGGLFAGTAGGVGASGPITIDITGNITASGVGGIGILAQSLGSNNAGDIAIELAAGHEIQGGVSNGVGVQISGGLDNNFTNYGTVRENDLNGTAIIGDTGNDTVSNYGDVIGSVNLGTGANTFNNEAGALLQSGAQINLAAGGTFYNAGTISPGGFGTVQTTALTGNFTQTGNAVWYDDITPNFTSDYLAISGTADLGNFQNVVNLNQLLAVPSLPGAYTLISAASGLTGSFQFGTLTGFTMPIGLTYTLANSNTEERLLLSPSTGAFYWNGAVDSVWNTDFVNGQSNWTSNAAGTAYIYGTPGVASDVYFASVNPLNSHTTVTLGANFIINSLTVVGGTPPVTIEGPNTLSIAAAHGAGITLDAGAPATDIAVDLALAGNQSWTNNSSSLLTINGPTITSAANHGLTVAGAGDTDIYAQVATGSGSLSKAGTGTLILYNPANLYRGGTNIRGGVLAVGSAGALGLGNVLNSATLQTTESLGGAVRNINVAGNYAQTAAGTLLLEVVSSPFASQSFDTGTPGINYEKLDVVGSADLGGTLDMNFAAATVATAGQHYVAVTAGNPLTGAFIIPTATNLPAPYYTITTENDTFNSTEPANSAIVTLMKPFTAFAGLNPNQTNVADGIDKDLTNLNNGGFFIMPLGATADFFNNIVTGLNTAAMTRGELGQTLDQLSPERLELFRNVAFDNFSLFTQQLDDHLANLRDGFSGFDTSGFAVSDSTLGSTLSQIKGRLLAWQPSATPGLLSDTADPLLGGMSIQNAPSADNQRWSVFLNGNVVLADLDSNPDVSHSNYTTGGMTVGADYRLNQNWTVGALFSYSHTDLSLDEEGSSATIDSYAPGFFAAYADHGWYANGLFDYGYNSYTEDRDIIFPGVNRTAAGAPQGNQYSSDLDGGYDVHLGEWTIGPSAGLDYVHLDINSFSEADAGAAGLNIQHQGADSLRSRLGFTTRWNTKYMAAAFSYHFSAYWQHEYMDNSTGITSSLETPETTPFIVQGTNASRDSALLDAGVDAQVAKSADIFIDYQAEAGQSDFFGQSVQAGVKVQF